MQKRSKRRKQLIILLALIVLGFATAVFYYAFEYYNFRRDGQEAQRIAEMMQKIFEEDAEGEYALQMAREETGNTDIVAYILIADTNIRNVVVQGADNDFYLNRDVFRAHNVNGSLFLDYRNAADFTDPNTIIYGHNVNNGTMFHNLRHYVDPGADAFFEGHSYITVLVGGEMLTYEIFSAFITHINFNYVRTEFAGDQFAEFIAELNRRNTLNTDRYATEHDRVLLLSTCTNISRDTRIVVAGRLVSGGASADTGAVQ